MATVLNPQTFEFEQQSHRNYPSNWHGEGWYPVLPDIENDIRNYLPYVEVEVTTIEVDGVEVEVVTSFVPLEPPEPEVEEVVPNIEAEISMACKQAIYLGFDMELTEGEPSHFSLTENDQINLSTAYATVEAGAEGYPYHADGELCRLFSAQEIGKISEKATAHKLYHTTYCNHLLTWARRAETVEELEGIYYGAQLPDDLMANMETILSKTSTL